MTTPDTPANNDTYDLVIIGSGPGGYVAAVRATQLGLKTALVEKHSRLGGVCLNVGCIPSKALLDSSEYYHLAKEHFQEHGIQFDNLRLDLDTLMARKQQVVEELTGHVRKLLEGNKVTVLQGLARPAAADEVAVTAPDGQLTCLKTRCILLATGSQPVPMPGLDFDGERVISSTEALSLKAVPQSLGVVGGGYIGLELGALWQRLGSQVTVVEMLPQIAGGLDGQVSRTLKRLLTRQGMTIKLKTRVTEARITEQGVAMDLEAGSKKETLEVERLLVAIGRRPRTQELQLDQIGIATDRDTGQVQVNAHYQTSIPSIYAIGDLIPGPMLAHKASAEGIVAVEHIAGQTTEVNYDTLPGVIYSWPEVASVGLTEEQAKAREIPYCTGTYPFSGAGRARCMGEKDGFVKILAHSRTDRILGVHIIGPRAADMIAECVLAMEFGASSEDLARTVHGHPTFAEALQEAALAVRKCSIYAS